MFKKHMTPLSKGGQTVKHAGKGSSQAAMPNRSQINALGQPGGGSMNNYAKATPMPGTAPPPPPMAGGGPPPGGGGATPGGPPSMPPPGLGTGNFSGVGS